MSRLATIPSNKDLVKIFEDGTFGEYILQCSLKQLDPNFWLVEDKVGCRVLNTEDIYDTSTPPVLIYPKGWYEVKEVTPITTPKSFAWVKVNEGGGSVEVDDITITTDSAGRVAIHPLGVDTDYIKDKAVTADKLNDMGASNGQILKYVTKTESGVTTSGWEPSSSIYNIVEGKILKDTDHVQLVDDKLKGDDLMLRFMFEPNESFEHIYAKKYTLDKTNGKLDLYLYKKVSADTNIRVLVN